MTESTPLEKPTFGFRFDSSYANLPEEFYSRQPPTPVAHPSLVVFNEGLAADLGLEPKALKAAGAGIFAGSEIPPGARPLAQAYAGHQFGHLTMLGDGRALLLGEQLRPDGGRVDIQLKGSGPTAFSRRGDGRATLGSMLREYIVSEAMHALHIPTTRSLAVAATGEMVYRETSQPGAVLTRVAASHIRVGTFEFALHYGDANQKPELVRALADYAIDRHYPELRAHEDPYRSFLEQVLLRQAALMAKWMSVGFIHGVMNTDNMAVSGETIDYGPCAFMDTFAAGKVFSSIDRAGRYAFQNQPAIALWNLTRLAECLLPLLDRSQNRDAAVATAEAILASFPERFEAQWSSCLRAKLGLFTEEAGDRSLAQVLLDWMEASKRDFTLTFRTLSDQEAAASGSGDQAFADWYQAWQQRLQRQPESWSDAKSLMDASNPAVIPRNHRIEQVILAASAEQDYEPLHRLIRALALPFEDRPEFREFQLAPTADEQVTATFCGT